MPSPVEKNGITTHSALNPETGSKQNSLNFLSRLSLRVFIRFGSFVNYSIELGPLSKKSFSQLIQKLEEVTPVTATFQDKQNELLSYGFLATGSKVPTYILCCRYKLVSGEHGLAVSYSTLPSPPSGLAVSYSTLPYPPFGLAVSYSTLLYPPSSSSIHCFSQKHTSDDIIL